MQLPPEHVWPVAQAVPHAPQFAGSLRVFVHCAPQNVWPPGHVHEPAVHARPPLHCVLHVPQFASSVVVSTH
jgi:hypothetical protein